MRALSTCAAFAALLAAAAPARGDVPFVVVRDDGTLEASGMRTADDINEAANLLLDLYLDTGAAIPEVMSVWTTFPLGSSSLGTLYLPLGNGIRGIGLETAYGGDGTFPSPVPPLRAILLHNDVTDLEARAARHDAPVEGYGQYLFLLELSHSWGPAAQLPTSPADALIGFDFHWSFWLDTGGAPAGGNRWQDNGDGTFTTLPLAPSEVTYSMLDLYLMGLADESEVPPIGLIEAPEAPAVRDPVNGGNVAAHTFPWFSAEPLTVGGRWREVTIEEVVEANGPRDPAFGEASTTIPLGVVLVVGREASEEEVADLVDRFDELAETLAPAYDRATGGRGSLEVVTWTAETPEEDGGPGDAGPDGAADAGTGDGGPEADADGIEEDGGPRPSGGGGSCATAGPGAGMPAGLAFLLVAALLRRSRARA